jgi:hypothetical protein
MRKLFGRALIAPAFTTVAVFAADNSLGAWKFNPEKLKIHSCADASEERHRHKEAADGGVKVTTVGERTDGTRNTLIKYRLQLPGFELPQAVRDAQQEFDNQLGRMLDGMADRLEGKASDVRQELRRSFDHLQESALTLGPEANSGRHPFGDISSAVPNERELDRFAGC